jgi:putative oxidoreductase
MSYGLLLLRVVVGLLLGAHGSQKLFGLFGGHGLRGTAGFFGESLSFRAPVLMAFLAGLTEFGGVLFALGFLTPLAAVGMVATMVVAIATVHWKNGFFVTNGGYEFNLVLATVAVAVCATGPGRFSLDRAIGWDDNLSGLWWAVGVAAVGIAGALATVGVFRATHRERLEPHAQH